MVSVYQREMGGAQNPRAIFKAPITIEDVLNSRMIAYPFRLLQCCLVTDGGCALILVSAERARDFPQRPVYLLGTGESVETADGEPNVGLPCPRSPSFQRGHPVGL
jgi:acetyl-CoA acetyltransferase